MLMRLQNARHIVTAFTGSTSSGQKMKYTVAIPPTNKTVTFRGHVSNYTSFSIAAEVKG